MHSPALPHAVPLAINLNSPGSFVHWSIFNISVANLVLIAVMVVIFGVALLLPFPRAHSAPPDAAELTADGGAPAGATVAGTGTEAPADPETARMWTNRVRRRALAVLPPGKLLPDKQPSYVASWIYVFGVASIAALAMAIISGFALALGGPDWWHYNPVGHFFNSMHLWSVELFMAFLVIHLWGKFWMAAWRGRRTMTWITGVVAFVASVLECFTGYLSQQNFDSQWISTSGKDAFNSVGVGAFFNVMNFGQMLMWHIVLLPIVLIAIVGAHVLLVRVRGVSHPIDAHTGEVRGHGRIRRRALAKAGRRTVARPEPPLRHSQGGHHRDPWSCWCSPWAWPACCPPLTCRRSRSRAGPGSRLPTSWRPPPGAERHQRDRHLRAAVQQPERQRPASAVLPADLARRDPAGQRGPGLRSRAADHARAHRPGDRRPAVHLQVSVADSADELG